MKNILIMMLGFIVGVSGVLLAERCFPEHSTEFEVLFYLASIIVFAVVHMVFLFIKESFFSAEKFRAMDRDGNEFWIEM